MDDRSGFEARAVIAPAQNRRARIALFLPVLVLFVIAWVGMSGTQPDHHTAAASASVIPVAIFHAPPAGSTEAPYPAQVVGFTVQRLDAISLQDLQSGGVIAIAGWYSPQVIAACPASVTVHSPSPDAQAFIDPYAYCARTGVFYATQPAPDAPVVIDSTEGAGSRSAGLQSVAASLISGVVAPPKLEVVGGDAAEVVVLAHFADPGTACRGGAICPLVLTIDYVPWTPDS